MDGFKKMDEKFVKKFLSPAYRTVMVQKLEKSRVASFVFALIGTAGGTIEYIYSHQLDKWALLFVVGFWGQFIFIDYEVKLIKLFDKIKAGNATKEELAAASEDIERDQGRSALIFSSPFLIIAACFLLWFLVFVVGYNILPYFKHFAASNQGHKVAELLSFLHL